MRLSKVSFRYRRRDPFVIQGADAELAPGDIVELTGVNGAGKSTLLRLLAGLYRPTQGTIGGRPAVVGFAPDRFPTGQPFTVAAYLRHVSRMRGSRTRGSGTRGSGTRGSGTRGGARWEPWAERLHMEHLLDTPLGELSKGGGHKVGLAQALMADPGLLIMDEPFAGLDAATRAVLPDLATEVAGRGGIVVVSDHQGGLRALPALRHWAVTDGRLHEPSSPVPVSDELVTVAVQVPAGELPRFLARMRGEGYPAREIEESAR
jgi:ABC-type multidrug transport system ATPase subunit